MPAYVTILRIHGPFLFGTTDKLVEETLDLTKFAPIVILRLRNMTAIDATGIHALEMLNNRLRKSGRVLLLCGAKNQPAEFLKQAEFVEHIGRENILPMWRLRSNAGCRSIPVLGVGEEVARDMANARL